MEKITVELTRPYWALAFGAIVCTGLGGWGIWMAETNQRGLIINGIIPMSPDAADVLYGVLGAFLLAVGVLGFLQMVRLSVRRELRLVLDARAVSFPHVSILGIKDVRLGYGEITRVGTGAASRQGYVFIDSIHGKKTLGERFLPRGWPPTVVAETILKRCHEWRLAKASGAQEGPPEPGESA